MKIVLNKHSYRFSKIRSFGVGLIELMLVLSIISVLLMTSIKYYAVAQNSHRTTVAAEMVTTIISAGERWLIAKNDYTDVGIKELLKRGYLPQQYEIITNVNPWGGSVNVSDCDGGHGMMITIEKIPGNVCLLLSRKLLTLACLKNGEPPAEELFCHDTNSNSGRSGRLTIGETQAYIASINITEKCLYP